MQKNTHSGKIPTMYDIVTVSFLVFPLVDTIMLIPLIGTPLRGMGGSSLNIFELPIFFIPDAIISFFTFFPLMALARFLSKKTGKNIWLFLILVPFAYFWWDDIIDLSLLSGYYGRHHGSIIQDFLFINIPTIISLIVFYNLHKYHGDKQTDPPESDEEIQEEET